MKTRDVETPRPVLGSPMDVPRARPRTRRWIAYVSMAASGMVAVVLGLARLRAAAPTVDRSSVWLTTVERGTMVRDVQGQGTLVPEEIRWITAKANARVERVLARPGATVE